MANDKQLHAQAGLIAVLHTHSRRLNYHPHVHIVIPAGGIDNKREGWVSTNRKFLFEEKNLASVFRARVLQSIREGGISPPSILPRQWIADCEYAGHGAPALKYLSRYLYRGVISENNIIEDDGSHITFRYQCSNTKKWKTRRLPGVDFLRLLFRHVLPKGFRRVRDYGFLHGNAKLKLRRIQLILRVSITPLTPRLRPQFLCSKCKAPMNITAFIRPTFSSG